MRTNTFKHLERVSNPYMEGIAKECLESNLMYEVELTMKKHDPSFDISQWKENFKAGRQRTLVPFVGVDMDMGWQKRSSGRRYDSNSGHAFMYGVLSRRPIMMCVKSKYCSICNFWQKKRNRQLLHSTSVKRIIPGLLVQWSLMLYWR